VTSAPATSAAGQDPGALAVAAVRSLAPYVIGKPVGELERELGVTDVVKLASNENPLGPSPVALAAMRAALEEVWLYPDGNGHDLKAAICRHHGAQMSQVTLGNGSNDLIVLLAEAFLTPQLSAVVSQHAFAIYALAIQAVGAQARVAPAFATGSAMPHGHDLEAMLALVDDTTRLVYVANPNNPTGTWNETAAILRFLDRAPPTTLVVLDEAYFEYARSYGCPDGSELVGRYPNLVVLRTFSKAHALAGVRVGYALSHPGVADMLNRVRAPFNVGIPGLVGAAASLGDVAQVQRAVRLADDGKRLLLAELPKLGVGVRPSAGNFVLADVGASGQAVYERLLGKGIIVRPVAGYGLPRCVRITIGTAAQNDRLLAALPDCL
jgi:histidinol-phosphate aminotransferase